jgi:hypothetical protein
MKGENTGILRTMEVCHNGNEDINDYWNQVFVGNRNRPSREYQMVGFGGRRIVVKNLGRAIEFVLY